MRCFFLLMLVSVFSLRFVNQAEAAKVNIVHGINGRDIGAERHLPVDVSVDGKCILTDFQFRSSDLVDLPPGSYEVAVHLSDGSCSEETVVVKSLSIPEFGGDSFSVLVGLTQSGQPEIFISNNSAEAIFAPAAVRVRHFAKAGPVTVKFSSNQILKSITTRLRNGRMTMLSVLTNRLPYTVNITANRKLIARRSGVSRRYTIFNVVGSGANGFTIIPESLPS